MTATLLTAGLPAAMGTVAMGCAHPAAGPQEVVRAFAGRVVRGEWDQAYSLMSDDYRRRVSLENFRRDMEAERSLVNAGAQALSRSDALGPTTAVIDLQLPDRDRIALAFDGTAWKLVDQPLAPFGQQSPRAALRTFVRAIDLKRYDVLLRLVPTRQRAGVTESTLRAYWEGAESSRRRSLLARLRANFGTAIVDLGVEAYMPYSAVGHENAENDEGEVRFLMEEGVWKIEDAR